MLSTSDPDRAVVESLRVGDEAQFVALVRRHDATMRRVAGAYLSSEAPVAQVVADTWRAVLEGLDAVGERCSLRASIFRALVDHTRRRGGRLAFTTPGPSAPGEWFAPGGDWARPPRPWQRLAEQAALDEIGAALDGLPEAERVVVCLQDVAALSGDEVCAVTGLAPATRRALLNRGRARLRTSLDRQLAAT